jgi:hypothetical protein
VGGLGVGHGQVALVLTAVIAILVGYLAVTRKDVEDPRQAAAPVAPAGHRRAGQQRPGYSPGSQPVSPRAARPDPPLRYPGRYPDERYPERPRPAPPRQPREPWPPQERQPSRQSRQPPEPWPDEDEDEHTAWGFFMWDE